jgi:hypothetical protein
MKALRLATCAFGLLVVGIARGEEEDPPKDNTRPDVGARYERAWGQVHDVSVSRREILADLKALALAHPTSEYAHRARQDAAILAQMVREDEERARRPVVYERLSKQEQIAECIFCLRDFGVVQWSTFQLTHFGYEAVPALIGALRDERFTRFRFRRRSSPMRVGAAALLVLGRIANRQFRQRDDAYEIDRSDAARKKVLAWWKEAQKKGEKRMWVEGTEPGDDGSDWDASRLVERYPEVALNSIAKGVRRSKDVEVRCGLLNAASHIKDARVIDLLRQQAKGPHWKLRLLAAQLLHQRGRPEGAQTLIREWRGLGKEPSREQVDALIEALLETGKPEAIAALGADLRKRSVEMRWRLLLWVGSARRRVNLPAKARTTIDQLLVECLDDQDAYAKESRGNDNEVCFNPRICDWAALLLAEAWSPAVSFRKWSSTAERDRQIVSIKNYWRLKQNLRPLPLPPP